ncbi:MAG: CPBP family intramembrane metalloprotease [Flavobacteriales bacterium]|nr:CPBP family intramembrane metalloprotease [Flavobacteriales bacterium]
MEHLSAPAKRSPEPPLFIGRNRPEREVLIGMVFFLATLALFFGTQSIVMLQQAWQLLPELIGQPFDGSLLKDNAVRVGLAQLAFHGDVVALAALWSGVVGLAALWAGTRLWKHDGGFRQLLGLYLPSAKQLFLWVGVFLALAAGIETLGHFFTRFTTDYMARVLGSTTNMTLLVLGVGVVAPVFEEFLLRGLFYGALRHALDPHQSIALTAGIFALMHLQYNWPVMLLILPLGALFGYARYYSGSLLLPILLHMLNNLAGVFFGA